MTLLLVAAVLSLVFFSVAFAVEFHRGEHARARELLAIVGLSLAVAAFASHEIMVGQWTMLATACDSIRHCD